jgi:hypothetical protein
MKAQSERLVSVYCGSHAMAELLATRLRDNDVQAFTPDLHMKALDPLDVGGNIFDVHVLVAREDAERAEELVGRLDRGAEPKPLDPVAQLRGLRTRMMWCALLPLFGPIGLFFAVRYFTASRELRSRLDRRWLAPLITAVCGLQTVGCVAVFGWFPGALGV